MAKLAGDAATPLHKLDIVQVVLNATQVTKAKGDKRHVACPVEFFLSLDNLQSSQAAMCNQAIQSCSAKGSFFSRVADGNVTFTNGQQPEQKPKHWQHVTVPSAL